MREWKAIDIINQRIYKELDIIEEESKKSIQMGAVKDRSSQIAVEMNFLRKALEHKDGEIKMAERWKKSVEDRSDYLEGRLKEEKEKVKEQNEFIQKILNEKGEC